MRFLLLIFIPFLLCSSLFAQDRNQKHANVAIYNIGFGAISGGVGSCINKKSEESLGHAFLNGAWKGAVGGVLTYTGKRLTAQITRNKNLVYGWPAKLVHTTGASFLENASANRPILSYWAIEYAFLRLDIGNKTLLRLQPFAASAFVTSCIDYNFDLKNSLITGTPLFKGDNLKTWVASVSANRVNCVSYTNDINYKQNIAHELIHTFQNREYLNLNTYGNKIDAFLKNKTNVYNRASNFIYLDCRFIKPVIKSEVHRVRKNGLDYYDNFFEYEAEFTSGGSGF